MRIYMQKYVHSTAHTTYTYCQNKKQNILNFSAYFMNLAYNINLYKLILCDEKPHTICMHLQ